MRLVSNYQDLSLIPIQPSSTVVGIGNFDGVHFGHQALINKVIEFAQDKNLRPSVLTFSPHPLRFFKGSEGPQQIYSSTDRQDILRTVGIELLLTQEFDLNFARLSPRDFVKNVLIDALRASYVVVGYDFAFGAKRSGTLTDLKSIGNEYGLQVEVVAAQHPQIKQLQQADEQRPFSSTWIRELIRQGQVKAALLALGRYYHLRGQVTKGLQRGRKLGFPTANLKLESEICPMPGVYAGWLDWGIGPQQAVVSIGLNPTFNQIHLPSKQQQWSVEVHLLSSGSELKLDIYDATVILWFSEKIRDMKRFTGVNDLIKQIEQDCVEAKSILNEEELPQWPRLEKL